MNDDNKGLSEAHPPQKNPGAEQDPAAAALAQILESERAAAAGDQLALIDDGSQDELDDILPRSARTRLTEKRARGRPAGSGNKRTEIVREYLLKKGYVHPLEVLAAIASCTPEELVETIGGTKAEAIDRIIKSADILAPYFESKRPQQLDVRTTKRHLFLAGTLAPAQTGGKFPMFMPPQKVIDNQADSESNAVRPAPEQSHGDSQAIDEPLKK